MRHEEKMWAEQKPDVYAGEKCDEHEAQWDMFCDGDKDGDVGKTINLLASKFPAGTKVVVSYPVCPKCDELTADFAQDEKCPCGFDWHNWVDEQYS